MEGWNNAAGARCFISCEQYKRGMEGREREREIHMESNGQVRKAGRRSRRGRRRRSVPKVTSWRVEHTIVMEMGRMYKRVAAWRAWRASGAWWRGKGSSVSEKVFVCEEDACIKVKTKHV